MRIVRLQGGGVGEGEGRSGGWHGDFEMYNRFLRVGTEDSESRNLDT